MNPRLPLLGLVCLWIGAWNLGAATRVWTGAFNTNLATARNWVGNRAPSPGDALVFPDTSDRRDPWNTLVSTFSSITFNAGYTVGGSPFRTRLISLQSSEPDPFITESVQINVPLILSNPGVLQVTAGRMSFLREVTLPPTGASLSVFRWQFDPLVTRNARYAMGFQGIIGGTGGIRKVDSGDVFFRTNNTYTGGTIIEAGALHLDCELPRSLNGPPSATPLGPFNSPVEVRNGGSLVIWRPLRLDYKVSLAGFGERGLGALRAVGYISRGRSLLKEVSLNSSASINAEGVQTMGIGRIDSQFTPPPTLTLQGSGQVVLAGTNAHIATPLRVMNGTFAAFNTNLETAPVSEMTWPRVQRAVRVEPESIRGNNNPIADLRVPELFAENLPPGANVLDPQAPVTVSLGEVWYGPRQEGLGSPLTLQGARMLLYPRQSQPEAVAATHTGTIEVVGGPLTESSSISGPLGIPGTLTIHSSSTRAPELVFQAHPWTYDRGWLEGETLAVDGVNLVLQGRQANRLNNLFVTRGEVRMSQRDGPGAARTNIVGDDTATFIRARLLCGRPDQFPAGAELEIRSSGAFELNGNINTPIHVSRLRVHGGHLGPNRLTCDMLEFTEGSRLLFGNRVGVTNLTVTGEWRWQGEVRATFDSAISGELGTPICLIDNQGPNPIPGVFKDSPPGSMILVQGTVYRLNYQGGDGNDLWLEPASSVEPPPLAYSASATGGHVLRWPASAKLCTLEYRNSLTDKTPWLPFPFPPRNGPDFEVILSEPGFYRLRCP